MCPEMMQLELHNGFASHGKSKMARLDDPGVDWAHRHFKHPFPLNAAEVMLALLSTQYVVPGEVFFERVGTFGPMLVPDQASQVRMSLRNQSKHVANLSLVPLCGMNVRRDGGEQPISLR